MNLLLDTHIFLWLSSAPKKIPSSIYKACEDTQNKLYLSLVSPWEVQIKQQLGKLRLHCNLSDLVETQIEQNGLTILPVKLTHIYAIGDLPYHHKDPFDRLLIAQAKVESLTLVTVDEQIGQYDISTLG